MTLSRQLISMIVIIFLLIVSSTFWITVQNTRSYLTQQLTTQMQDAADSLGLSLAPHLKNRDIATIDTMINAVFDHGYYRELRLESISGKVIAHRENTSRVEGVPDWFIRYITLETPRIKTVITTGWSQTGRLWLTAHPGYAYKKLWDTSSEIFWWSLMTLLLSLVAVITILRKLLAPLKDVENQALAICDREFPIVENIPWTREFRQVVLAMNRMSQKLEGITTNLSGRAEKMRLEARVDSLTGLSNRREFIAMLNNILLNQDRSDFGSLAILRVNDFTQYNQKFGYQSGDQLLEKIAAILKDACSNSESYPARIGGADFAVILPSIDATQAEAFSSNIFDKIAKLQVESLAGGIAHIGLISLNSDMPINEILAHADLALATAKNRAANSFHYAGEKNIKIATRKWRETLNDILDHKYDINFLSQSVTNTNQQPIYRELLLRISSGSEEELSPGTLIPMAERLNLTGRLDQHVIEKVISIVEKMDDSNLHVAINLSHLSIQDSDFTIWLEQCLKSHPALSGQLIFELTEYGLLQNISTTIDFIELIHSYGSRIVMERFGTRLNSFHALRQLKLDYIKLDGSYIRNISEEKNNQFFLQTVTDIAHGLDIKVIAEHIESEADLETIRSLGVDAAQGYFIEKPQHFPAS